jgi:superfamily II DNA or RNA helicase
MATLMAHHLPESLSKKLWPHQRDAIEFALDYVREPYKADVALVRMPTGTGKTGVIASLSVALPPPRWTIILTPWKNLCDQMIEDLGKKFWESRGWIPPKIPNLMRLYPKNVEDVVDMNDSNIILVATFAALVTIFKRKRDAYEELSDRLSQVFVDEGHYEPAVEWGQSVKKLKSPTILLTATPYRNDLKLFRVDSKDVFHYTHRDAEADGIIRPLSFHEMAAPEPRGRNVTEWCEEFRGFWSTRASKGFPRESRAIICCTSAEIVSQVTRDLRDQGVNALGIHETFRNRPQKWLRRETPKPREVNFDVWVHQNKLTEGLDDSRFAVLAIVNRIRNDRKLIQQIGRVLRRGMKGVGKAILMYPQNLTVDRSWRNYREFETRPDSVDPERYHKILENALQQQPDMEYFGGRFRYRFAAESPTMKQEVLLRASAIVRRTGKKFDWEEFTSFTSDYLLLEDCILLGPDRSAFEGPEGSQLWVYAMIGNSPILREHSQYEIRLGAMAAVEHKDLLFVTDTEGMYPTEYLIDHSSKISPRELGRIFGRSTIPKEVSLTNAWPAGSAILRSSVFSKDLSGTPAQLTDSIFVCGGARASVPSGGRYKRQQYAGFVRGRVSEELRSSDRSVFSLAEFVAWSKELAEKIKNHTRTIPTFFHRYLSSVAPPALVEPRYFMLNLPEEEVEAQDEQERPVQFGESMIEREAAADGEEDNRDFAFKLSYTVDGGAKQHVAVVAHYDSASSRFRFSTDGANSTISILNRNTEDTQGFAAFLNNNDDAYVIALDRPDLFYTGQAFYQIDYTHAEKRLARILTPVAALGRATSEKGHRTPRMPRWDRGSLFALIGNRPNTGFTRTHFGEAELVICEDLGVEVGDFVCVNFSKKKIAFLHAKCGKGRRVSASALHEAVAQAIKNLGIFSRGGEVPKEINRWTRDSMWAGTRLRRWRLGSARLPIGQVLWKKIREEILEDPEGTREVWLVLGQTLDKSSLIEQLEDRDERSAVTGQVVQLLSTLQASCTQVNVNLRVFCN